MCETCADTVSTLSRVPLMTGEHYETAVRCLSELNELISLYIVRRQRIDDVLIASTQYLVPSLFNDDNCKRQTLPFLLNYGTSVGIGKLLDGLE